MRKRIMVLAGVVLLCSLTGCKNRQPQSGAQSTNKTTYTAKPVDDQPEEEAYVSCVDMQAVIQNVAFFEKPIAFPASLAELGVSLTYADVNRQRDEKTWYMATITDGAALNTNVEMYSDSVLAEGKVYELQANSFNGVQLSVMGVGIGAAYDQMIAAFGEPSSTSGTLEGNLKVYYENCADEFLMFSLEQGQVTTIMLHYLPPEWR